MGVEALESADAKSRATGSAVYVYGVVWAKDTPAVRAAGVGGGKVETLPFENLAALVSSVRTPIKARRRELLSHSEVVNEVAAGETVLPLRFGTTFADEDLVVSELLAPRHDELTRLLRRLDGLVELVVKAFYVEEAILAEIVREEPRIAQLREATRTRPAAATHAGRIELGTAVAAALDARTRQDAAEILRVLQPLARDLAVDETPIEHQVIRASVLVERGRVADADAALAALAERNAGRIRFSYVGPLAPHSFTSLSLGGG